MIQGLGSGAWGTLTPFSVSAGSSFLNQGMNTLTISITGTDNYLEGVRLEGTVSAVPEPGEWALMLGGLSLMGFIAMRRAKAAKTA